MSTRPASPSYLTRPRVLAALVCGCEAAVVVYVAIRVVQAIFIAEPNPATSGPSLHSGYFWRVWIAAYGGGFVALAVGLLLRSAERVLHVATRLLPYAVATLVMQALFLP
jgi:hypothetical protein